MTLRRKSPLADIDENDIHVGDRKEVAVGLPAIAVSMKRSLDQMGATRTARTLLRLNQVDGFDCQGCAWPDPDPEHRHTAEFCENGAKAVAEEATTDRLQAGVLRRAQHRGPRRSTPTTGWASQGRLVHPMVRRRDGAALRADLLGRRVRR